MAVAAVVPLREEFNLDAFVREHLAACETRNPDDLEASALAVLSAEELAEIGRALLRRRLVEEVNRERTTRVLIGGGSPRLQAIRDAQRLHPFDCWYQLPDGTGGYLRDFTVPQVERLADHRRALVQANHREQKRFERLSREMKERKVLRVGRLPRRLGEEIFGG